MSEKSALAYGYYRMAVEEITNPGPQGMKGFEFTDGGGQEKWHITRARDHLNNALQALEGMK